GGGPILAMPSPETSTTRRSAASSSRAKVASAAARASPMAGRALEGRPLAPTLGAKWLAPAPAGAGGPATVTPRLRRSAPLEAKDGDGAALAAADGGDERRALERAGDPFMLELVLLGIDALRYVDGEDEGEIDRRGSCRRRGKGEVESEAQDTQESGGGGSAE